MEDNRAVKMGIDGEGGGVGGERTDETGRIGGFVEHNIPGDVNLTKGDIQTLITFMRSRLTYEGTLTGPKIKLISLVLTQKRVASTTKNT